MSFLNGNRTNVRKISNRVTESQNTRIPAIGSSMMIQQVKILNSKSKKPIENLSQIHM